MAQPAVRIVTDGAADLPADLAERLEIAVVSGPVRLGGEEWYGTPAEFWRGVRTGAAHPSTKPPTAEQFAAFYEGDGDGRSGLSVHDGRPVLSLHVSSELSLTYANASRAARTRRVEVVDTRSFSVGTGMIAVNAAEAVAAGVAWEDLPSLVGRWIDRLHVHAVIDDPSHLIQEGRGGLLGRNVAHPHRRHVLAVRGHAIPICQVRQRSDALRELEVHVRQHVAEGAGRWAVGHGDASDTADVVARLADSFGGEPLFVAPLGPVVGTHVGPGAVVVAFFADA